MFVVKETNILVYLFLSIANSQAKDSIWNGLESVDVSDI